MGTTLRWRDNNAAEDGHRVYRGTAPLDPEALPAPLATLAADVTEYYDIDVVEGQAYYYRVGSYVGSVERVSEELQVEALWSPAPVAESFDDLDLTTTPDALATEVAARDAELVAAFRDGAIAEDSAQVAALTDWGQHKWPQELADPIGRLWVLARDGATGDVLRVYAERATTGGPDTVISTPESWTFEALWQGQLYTGAGTWEFTDATAAFSNASLSSDDGAWAFMDGVNTQGNQSRPAGDLFGVGNWNTSDGGAVMSALTSDVSDFQGIVIFAPAL